MGAIIRIPAFNDENGLRPSLMDVGVEFGIFGNANVGNALRVAVIVPQGVFRSSLSAALEQYADIEPFGMSAVPEEGFNSTVDVVVLDLDFQPENHRELMRRLMTSAPEARVCVLAFRSLPATVRQCLSLGASGFMLKDCTLEELHRAVRAVSRGQVFIDPKIAGLLLRSPTAGPAAKAPDLSSRETDVIRLIALGLTNKQIAEKLDLSEKTIKNHISHIFRKLKITARTQAAIHAISNNLVR
ncbi:MAG TPA: response regulator transcription factor [Candidatus Eremiobacteraceae bacterium]|nr:response regulator transcription factor [Candidatus Eremiobacteraceae bacterium]